MTPQSQRREQIAITVSHLGIAAALLLIMWQGLLPGLLCACLGFLATRWFSPRLGTVLRSTDHEAPRLSAAIVALIPLIVIALMLPRARGIILDAPATYRELLGFMARTVLEMRERLPQDIAAQFPEGAVDVQRAIASYLGSKAGTLATTGRAWLSGLLFAYVGLLIGALAAARPSLILLRPLSAQLHLRLTRFGETFRQIEH